MELEELLEVIKEALAERLEPIEARLTKLEEADKALQADQTVVNETLKTVTGGIEKVAGKSQQITGEEAFAEKSDTGSARRDAWGRRLHSA